MDYGRDLKDVNNITISLNVPYINGWRWKEIVLPKHYSERVEFIRVIRAKSPNVKLWLKTASGVGRARFFMERL